MATGGLGPALGRMESDSYELVGGLTTASLWQTAGSVRFEFRGGLVATGQGGAR